MHGKATKLHLRLTLVTLNLHIFLKNITDSPLYRCGSIENTEHFFFTVGYYQDQRDELLSLVTPYQVRTVNLFLYGDKTLSQYTNTIIFESVQIFIIGTKRF